MMKGSARLIIIPIILFYREYTSIFKEIRKKNLEDTKKLRGLLISTALLAILRTNTSERVMLWISLAGNGL
jgi:hypothetical protein